MASRNHDQTWNFSIGNGKGERDAVTAVEERPGFASAIGVFVGLFGAIEAITPHLLTEITDFSDEESERLLGHIQSVSGRIDVIEEMVRHREISEEKRTQLLEIINEIRWINAERNKYLHAQYSSTGNRDTIRRLSFFSDTKKKKKLKGGEIFTINDVISDINRAKRLSIKLWDLLKEKRI